MRDDITHLYSASEVLEKFKSVFLYLNIVSAIAAVIFIDRETVSKICLFGQAISSVLFIALSIIDDLYCWFDAESARRKNSIENAFNVSLGELQTDGFYSNEFEPSIERYGANEFESIFYTKSIVGSMRARVAIRAVCVITILVVSCMGIQDKNTVLIVFQSALSIRFVEDLVTILRYYQRVDSLYSSMYEMFVTTGISTKEQKVCIL